jgi:hypothetical protein
MPDDLPSGDPVLLARRELIEGRLLPAIEAKPFLDAWIRDPAEVADGDELLCDTTGCDHAAIIGVAVTITGHGRGACLCLPCLGEMADETDEFTAIGPIDLGTGS